MEDSDRSRLLQEVIDEVPFDFVLMYNLPPGQERDWDLVNLQITTAKMRVIVDIMKRMDPEDKIFVECYPEQGQGFVGWDLAESIENDYYSEAELKEIIANK